MDPIRKPAGIPIKQINNFSTINDHIICVFVNPSTLITTTSNRVLYEVNTLWVVRDISEVNIKTNIATNVRLRHAPPAKGFFRAIETTESRSFSTMTSDKVSLNVEVMYCLSASSSRDIQNSSGPLCGLPILVA